MVHTKFLDLQTENHLRWKNCIEKMIPKLSRPCYAIRLMVCISNFNILKSIYYVYFHSVIKYGIFLGELFQQYEYFHFTKRKFSELWLVHKPELHVEVYLNNWKFSLFHASLYFH